MDYPAEKFTYDGKKIKINFVQHRQRSVLGSFIHSNNVIMEEGLLGGTLSTAWALLDMPNKKAKLFLNGTKKLTAEKFIFSTILRRVAIWI